MTRESLMVQDHGELITKRDAMRILHISRHTLDQLIKSHKILVVDCGNEKVDVRSIARYIDNPKKERKWVIA